MQYEHKEYPRPQFRREDWQGLNGEWEFAFDDKNEGIKSGLWQGKKALPLKINVPFTYEYPASGLGDPSQHDVVWYRRTFEVAEENRGRRALLCFNAADYQTDVWLNGVHVLTHTGGFTPFSADITGVLKKCGNVIVVRCEDTLNDAVPRGKQSWTGSPFSCFYVPNTGIWQSVWLEFFGEDCIAEHLLLCDYDKTELYGELATLYGSADEAEIAVAFDGKLIKRERLTLRGRHNKFRFALPRDYTDDYSWSPENPRLLYVDFALYKDGKQIDLAHARIGMRKISVDEHGKICLNNRPYYQRLVLDQGYWQESGLTPPSAEALRKDIELAKAMGFNGARKHQKSEDPYYCYYAEELGFLTWCEMPSAYRFGAEEIAAITREWQEIVRAGRNCTSNVCYVPLNESWGAREMGTDERQKDFARSLYYLTRALDPTRLISTNDGFEIVNPTDIVGVHDYDAGKAEDFQKYAAEKYDGMHPQGFALFAEGEKYEGQPALLTEFGGRAMQSDAKGEAWGYNGAAADEEAFVKQLASILQGVYSCNFQGYCYTQLTDVQQEVNGLLTADRKPKADLKMLKEIFGA